MTETHFLGWRSEKTEVVGLNSLLVERGEAAAVDLAALVIPDEQAWREVRNSCPLYHR